MKPGTTARDVAGVARNATVERTAPNKSAN